MNEHELIIQCTDCGRKAVTKDGRHICYDCLQKWLRHQNDWLPIKRKSRTAEQMQAKKLDENNPAWENAIRALEDSDIEEID